MVALARIARLVSVIALSITGVSVADAGPETLARAVFPVPQQLDIRPGVVVIPPAVTVMAGAGTDPHALELVKQVLRGAGAAESRSSSLTVYVGGPSENPATADALAKLRIDGPEGLVAGGYVLGAVHGTIALSGVDTAGTFHAAQTFRQLVTGPRLPSVSVRDWPATALRGVIEGFYGEPWSHADRLSQLDFFGRTKQNIYVYSPKDDSYLRKRWRDEYPADRLALLKELAGRATANHVDFTYALSPGLSVCYSDDADLRALITKFESLWAIGVRTFAVPLDDISYTHWNCEEDRARFGTGGAAAGAAQSYLLNRVRHEFIATHPGASRLQMVPTEYYDLADSGYKTAIRDQLDPAVLVEWTGVGVVATQITAKQAGQAKRVFGHDILVWDNYPVNDFQSERLFLGPYIGREPGVASALVGVTVNPMAQSEASKIAEFTSADFLWNPAGYDPDKSWAAALSELGGSAAGALKVVAENNFSSLLVRLSTGRPDQESPVLRGLATAFWQHDDGRIGTYFQAMAAAPAELRRGLPPAFLEEIGPWLDKLGRYGEAGHHAVKMLLSQRDGDGAIAWSQRLALKDAYARALTVETASGAKHPSVCVSVCAKFLETALTTADRWFGVTAPRVTGSTSLATYAGNTIDRMTDGDDTTYFWSYQGPDSGDFIGVDLGSVRKVAHLDLTMAKPDRLDDYIHAGVLEYSDDGTAWTHLRTVDSPRVTADFPPGAQARYVRVRATGAQNWSVAAREFTVRIADTIPLTVTGGPAGGLSAAADGYPDTAYLAMSAPAPGDALVVTTPQARPLDRVVILATAGSADVQAFVDGGWRTLGRLINGYTELGAHGIVTDRLRLLWRPGSAAPSINEVIPLQSS